MTSCSGNAERKILHNTIAYSIPSREAVLLFKGQRYLLTKCNSFSCLINCFKQSLYLDKQACVKNSLLVPSSIILLTPSKQVIFERLKLVFDPEIGVNIVDLGLIAEVSLRPVSTNSVAVVLIFRPTSPGCKFTDILMVEIRHSLLPLVFIKSLVIKLILDHSWKVSELSEEAKLMLGLI